MLQSLLKAHLVFHANVSPPAEHQIGLVAGCLKLAIRLWKLNKYPSNGVETQEW